MDAINEELIAAAQSTRIAAYMWSEPSKRITVPVTGGFIWCERFTIFQGRLNNKATPEFSTVQTSFQRSVCQVLVWFEVTIGGSTVVLIAIDIILGIRLYALYKRSRRVLIFLSCLVLGSGHPCRSIFCSLTSLPLGEFAIQAYVVYKVGLSAAGSIFIPPMGLPILGCLTDPDLRITMPSWISTPLIAAVYFVMMLTKFYETTKVIRSSGVRLSLSPLISAFVRDGTVYFLLIESLVRLLESLLQTKDASSLRPQLVTLLAGALDTFLTSGAYITLYQPWGAASFAITGTRLILNLKEAALGGNSDLRRTELTDLEPIQFAERRPVASGYETS
ncbi:hypothetical protein CVT26_001884 [Gymnopilus dilepis]|uniref:Uncharacterized protein n=1 Tax=Gymnopilus dilepis TaxID=231916 RepID=A0A409Y434_9AGAR|nr:hypothetical protein CVT26_001884 [Gymnopilus dilepis]